MRNKYKEHIKELEKRITELENPIIYKNGKTVRFEINGGSQTGIVINSEIVYRDRGWTPYKIPFNFVDYRRYQVLSNGEKYWFVDAKLVGIPD